MDAFVVDINHFRMINERFGSAYGDEVLCNISEKLREAVSDVEGIVCRREADTFMVYCPTGKDYKAILANATIGLHNNEEAINNRVRLRLGVYTNVDKSLDIERRFDRAKMAADTVRNSFTRTVGIYDDTMHERELYIEQLIEDFPAAIAQKQFQVYFQPKYDVRPKSPVLTSAEALVRWIHPKFGMVSPGTFIPLFEDNGLIQELDNYVWRETAAHLRYWKDHLGFSVPASVNVSRIDMYDPELIHKMQNILDENGLTTDDIYLEITESAYTENSEQIIDVVEKLRRIGFRIEMDDFGTGYSSLNMISSLPIDALKLDMNFVHSAFRENGDTRMLKVVIDIADHLSVPVIAEGVETEEQLNVLRDLGCAIVQGYFFSKPVPAAEFEPMLSERKGISEEALEPPQQPAPEVQNESPAQPEKRRTVELRITNYIFVILAFILAAALLITDSLISRGHQDVELANKNYISAELAAQNLAVGSDWLTASVRYFVYTGDLQYLNDYFEEANVTRRRDNAVADVEDLLGGTETDAYRSLSTALGYSNELMQHEFAAMRLVQLAYGYSDAEVPEEVTSIELSDEDIKASKEEKLEKASELVTGETYSSYKELIDTNADNCAEAVISSSEEALAEADNKMHWLLTLQNLLTILLMLAMLAETIFVTVLVRKPLTKLVKKMLRQEEVVPTGVAELQFVSRTYNEILHENRKKHQELTYEALHDGLTGLYNRNAYNMFIENIDTAHIALLIIDVDKFKAVNDTYGHDVGDKVLIRVSGLLMSNFRSVDIVCRFGGDEFVVIMTRVSSDMAQLVRNKIAHMNELLQNPTDGLPKTSLSVGVAFSDSKQSTGNLFKDADTALYSVKNGPRSGHGCAVFGDPGNDPQ